VDQRNRKSHKCGCESYTRVTLRRSFDIFLEEWQVTIFKDDHNHKLLSPEQVCFLSTYRSIDKETEKRILLFKEAGLLVRKIMCITELENNVKHGHLQFLAMDIHNLFGKVSRMMRPNDAMELLKFCKDAKDEIQYSNMLLHLIMRTNWNTFFDYPMF